MLSKLIHKCFSKNNDKMHNDNSQPQVDLLRLRLNTWSIVV